MVSLTATLFKAIINDAVITDANAEYIIDLAISEINLHSDAGLGLMTGTGGSKTVSLESKEYAAVMEVARAIYYGFYKKLETESVGGITISSPDLKSNPSVQHAIKEAARQLAEFDVSRG